YGEIFSLYVFGKIITIVGKETSLEVFSNHQNFNFLKAVFDTLPLGLLLGRPHSFFDKIAKVVRDELSNDLGQYTRRIQVALNKSINKFIGECKGKQLLMQIVAIPMASIIVGEDLANDEELINSFANLTRDIIPALSLPPFLNFIHPSLHTNFFVQAITDRIIQVIKQCEHKKRDFGSTCEPPANILQLFINLSEKDGIVDVEEVTDYIIDIIFAAIHTTSQAISNVLYEYGARHEYWKELLEENNRISHEVKDEYLSIQEVNKMVRLDSFIRETLRFWQPIVGLEHKTLNDFYTFSNGRNVYMYTAEIHDTDPNTNTFDGFQYVEKNFRATKTGREYILFGLGRHACPGRFFAVHTIKIALYLLIRKYKIVTESKNVVRPVFAGSFILPNSEGLIFENL
ncbi:793_t:CDS:10, partial [Dentiscutata heterogama]